LQITNFMKIQEQRFLFGRTKMSRDKKKGMAKKIKSNRRVNGALFFLRTINWNLLT